jgi:glycosyltransferase involved in cell wall biosynthesis
MRFTWLSNSPWSSSGYGQQTGLFLPRIKALGHEPAAICYFGLEGGAMVVNGIPCFPKRYHPYGNDIAVTHTANFGAQVMFSLMDTWVMNVEEYPQGFKWIPWFPVDHEPMPQIVRTKLNIAYKRIAISKFGEKATHAAGLDCYYIPHGVDTKVFHPMEKSESRRALGFPLDKWIVGTVAMNKGFPSRKNFFEMITAFANFHKRHPETFYFMQTGRGEGEADVINIPELCGNLGLVEGKDYGMSNPYQTYVGFPQDYLANLYNSLDVHMLVSAGEGFGIPILEAQACGIPVIVGDWTSMSELCLAGRMVDKKDAEPYYTGLAAYQYRPHIRAIEALLSAEYRKATPTAHAVQQVLAEYDVDVITETKWKPILAEIEASL